MPDRYHDSMAMNLRLGAEAEAALRAEAQRTGRSQQDILREAIGKYLGLIPSQAGDTDPLITQGKVAPPRVAFRDVRPRLHLQPGESSLDLLDRDDRI
ncbi:hypothetical protein Atai01_41200 [Amycolatopsis taiwanensis]|uniref:Ribbon-helix-helix protein CopG domain-containing protein n=2 Tax=Amycolatopsis taiwanensis TaxID=342230 RepID=A0A9W6R2D6_9PSEU|nr:hypothetical protein Atai01_41200 [Amycolatopsis taiwanensis]